MKVLIFTTQIYQLGGAERLAVESAEGLNIIGIQTDIMSLYTNNLKATDLACKLLSEHGIPNVFFLGLRIHPSYYSFLYAILKFRNFIIEKKYDIVETSMLLPTIIASWATKSTNVRHVAGIHQVFLADRDKSLKFKLMLFSLRFNKKIRFYAISNFVGNAWIKYSGIDQNHMRIVYNSVKNYYFETQSTKANYVKEFSLNESGRIVLFVGRLAIYKGIETVLNALGPILKSKDIYLLFIGLPDIYVDGTKEVLAEMKRKIISEDWNARVKFLGFRSDVHKLMASSDLLVHPTQIEGFGLVLVEALATGLPIVASNVEGIPEVLKGTDSILIPPDDPENLRIAVLKSLNRDQEIRNQIAQTGKKRARDFSNDKRISSLLNLFNDIIQGKI